MVALELQITPPVISCVTITSIYIFFLYGPHECKLLCQYLATQIDQSSTYAQIELSVNNFQW